MSYAILYFAFELITENDLSKMNVSMYIYFVVNGVLLLFTYPLMFLIEKTFGFTSNVTLVELSNINTPLLRRMAETVPGTFQHSMQVANLAAEAANGIGGQQPAGAYRSVVPRHRQDGKSCVLPPRTRRAASTRTSNCPTNRVHKSSSATSPTD